MAKKPTVKRMKPQRLWGVVWEGNVEPDDETLRYTEKACRGVYWTRSGRGEIKSYRLIEETKGGGNGKAK